MTEFIPTSSDGKPQGFTGQNRAQVEAVIISDEQHAIENDAQWNLTTGQVTLTDDNPTVIHYVSNDTFEGVVILPLFVLLTEVSTAGTGVMKVELIRNPTAGDIITNKNSGEAIHQNFGGAKAYPGDNFKGATSEGDVSGFPPTNSIIRSRGKADDRLLLGITIYLPQGASIAVRVTPPTGNTSMVIESVIEAFEEIN